MKNQLFEVIIELIKWRMIIRTT